ncbi:MULTISPECIES: DeoR/GlpR family DNA-binding transcription regulator [Clostridium]|uniref:DeoR/GlpR transcriptional regulator n=1 Tax=Clostridium cibarium TaxID=2762247 RepID=A0ABR8PRE8_9CLOT|nr:MULTISPECIES: DeoR/GlpR family DNA-binding transcription regulator [Clostridium]MBD7910744.1 DeoR/GlpR transcriptional regulator [Clostridium cibarium]
MLPRERLEIIKQIVKRDKKLYVSKLSAKFDVTEETIRRDLEKLETEGLVTRTYGGAILNSQHTNEEIPFMKRSSTNLEFKEAIALKAVNLIEQGSTIVADSSSTVLETMRLLKDRTDITIITNSVEALILLSDSSVNVLSTGGNLKHRSKSLQGSISKNTISNYNVDVALVSCKAIDMNKGILESNEAEAELKKVMIEQASTIILLVDSSKFDRTSFVKMFEYKDIDYIITDEEPSEEWKEFFELNNIEVIF